MISASALLLGIINIVLVVAVLLIVGAIIEWVLGLISFPVPEQVRKLYMIIVALVAIYLIAALLLGYPSAHIIHLAP